MEKIFVESKANPTYETSIDTFDVKYIDNDRLTYRLIRNITYHENSSYSTKSYETMDCLQKKYQVELFTKHPKLDGLGEAYEKNYQLSSWINIYSTPEHEKVFNFLCLR